MKKKLKYGSGRGLLFILAMIFCFAVLFNWPQSAQSGEKGGGTAPKTIEVSVKKGDTLWTLARKYGNEGRDIRFTVTRIREINQIGKKEHIYPGQSLFIPID